MNPAYQLLGMVVIIAVIIGFFLFTGLARKILEGRAKSQSARDVVALCPKCNVDLLKVSREKNPNRSLYVSNFETTCGCGTWSKWDLLGIPPLLMESKANGMSSSSPGPGNGKGREKGKAKGA